MVQRCKQSSGEGCGVVMTAGAWPGRVALLATVLTVVFLGAGTAAEAANVLVVKASGARLLDKPRLQARTLEIMKAGATLSGLERKGLFWKVRAKSGTVGFVVVTGVGGENDSMRQQVQGAMRSLLTTRRASDKRQEAESSRARATNAVMGIRGLESEDLSEVGLLRPNFGALQELEALEITPQHIESLASAVLAEAEQRSGLSAP